MKNWKTIEEEFLKDFGSLKAVKCEPDGHPITEDLLTFFKKQFLETIKDIVGEDEEMESWQYEQLDPEDKQQMRGRDNLRREQRLRAHLLLEK